MDHDILQIKVFSECKWASIAMLQVEKQVNEYLYNQSADLVSIQTQVTEIAGSGEPLTRYTVTVVLRS